MLTVYLSNLWEATAKKPVGYVLSGHEFRVAESMNNLFGSAPFYLPELVRGFIDSFWVGRRISLSVTVSPLTIEEIEFRKNMIVVGANVRNIVRDHYLNTGSPYLALAKELSGGNSSPSVEHGVRIVKGHQVNKVIEGDYNLAIVEKIYDREHDTVVFMCLGDRADSSLMATNYLVRNWRELSKCYPDKPFSLCLGFPLTENYMDEYREPYILESIP